MKPNALHSPSTSSDPPDRSARAGKDLSKGRQRRFALAAAVMAISIFAIGGEALTRLLGPLNDPGMHAWPRGYYTAESERLYHQSPGFAPTWMEQIGGRKNLVYANALGMRDVAVPPPAPGQVRILAIGCSMTECMGIEDPLQPWPRQLEKALNSLPNRNGKRYVVMNGGVAGYNSFQAVVRGEELDPAARPDVWILNYYSEMWYRNVFGPQGQFNMIWGSLFDRNSFEQIYPSGSLRRGLSDRSMLIRRLLYQFTPIQAGGAPDIAAFSDLESASRAAIASFKQAADRRGRPAMVAYLTYMPDLDKDDSTGHNEIFPLVEKICRELNVPILDPTPEMIAYKREHDPQAGYAQLWDCSPKDPHYLPEANRVYAEKLAPLVAEELKKMGFDGAVTTAAKEN